MLSKGHEFALFFVNGSVLGCLFWALQYSLFVALEGIDHAYLIACLSVYPLILVLNFLMQRKFVFARRGRFAVFCAINLLLLLLISFLALFLKSLGESLVGTALANLLAFPVAGLVMALPSYFLKRRLVFTEG